MGERDWVLVPMDATHEMLWAAYTTPQPDCFPESNNAIRARRTFAPVWRAMIAASPAPPQSVSEAEVERAARAIAKVDRWPWDTSEGSAADVGDMPPDIRRDLYRTMARFALTAARGGAR